MTNFPPPLTGRQSEYLGQRVAGAGKSTATIPRVPPSAEPVLSFAQERLWFLSQIDQDPSAYHRALNLRLRGALDIDALEKSLREIVRRHAPLRTNLRIESGRLRGITRADWSFRLERIDLAHLPAEEAEARARAIAQRAFAQPFDLDRDLMLRAMLICFCEREHYLVLTLHHIASDAWSDTVLLHELDTLYRAGSTSRQSDLEALPIQYSDYAAWQRAELQGERYERLVAYWREELAGLALCELPRDDTPDSARAARAAGSEAPVVQALLSKDLTARLRDLSRRSGVTFFMTLLAAFQVLLGRLAASDEIAVGTPVANRQRPETQTLIGCFINTLVLRGNLAGNPPFTDFLKQMRRVTLTAFDHQDLPFEKLVEELQPARLSRRSPFFQAFFNFTLRDANPPLGDLLVERVESAAHAARFDLNLYGHNHRETLNLTLVYREDLFERARMVELLRQYTGLLEQVVEEPARPVGEYSLVTAAATRILPDPGRPLNEPAYPGVLETFLEIAERTAERIAVEQGSSRRTYAELARAARKLATCLKHAGIRPGDIVAVTGERSFNLVTGLLGVMFSGGVLFTLDPALPPLRRELLLAESSAAYILETPLPGAAGAFRLVPTSRGKDGESRVLDLAGAAPLHEITARQPDDPTYIFFTSGSTGKPKAILGRYKGVNHFIHWQRTTFGITAQERVAQLTGLSFDPFLRDLFLPLTSGATLCVPPPALAPLDELSWLADAQVTLLHIVPARARFWLNHLAEPPSLRVRHTFFAGEPLPGDLVTRWRALCPPGSKVVNLYGPTETTLAKSYFVVPHEPKAGVQPIGVPQPETQLLVVNAADQLCGIGEPGEIVIRTPFRTLGYLNPPPAEAARFRVNWWTGDPSDLVFRTGDRARYLHDARVYLFGRADSQVKIDGVRVELHEIEAVLAGHPGVQECMVITRKLDPEENQLVAYVVLATPAPTIDELRHFLFARLLPVMVPAAFIRVDALPRLPGGKLDRTALALPTADSIGAASRSTFRAPGTELELTVAAIWQELLNLDRIGVGDNFFELGGHSLLAMQLLARLTARFGIHISLRDFFAAPSVQGIVRHMTAQLMGETPNPKE